MAVTVSSALLATANAAASGASEGGKNAAFCGAIATGIGSGYKLVARRSGATVLDMTMSGSLSASSTGIAIPDAYAALNILTAADIDSGTWSLRIEKASDANVYLNGTLGRNVGDFLLSDDLDPDAGIALSGVFLRSPSIDAVVGGSWLSVAVSDMRKVGWSGAYMDSYAPNDDLTYGRRPISSQRSRAQLSQGRYATSAAFTPTNPDYSEVAWVTDPAVKNATWSRIIQWTHIYMSETYKTAHASGWVNNTRVAIWDCQVWVKSKTTGNWTRLSLSNTPGGEWWTPDFKLYKGTKESTGDAYRIEGSGYPSIRTVLAATGTPAGSPDANVGYWLWHGYSGLTAITGSDVADVVSCCKTALVLHNAGGTDDRDASRFLFAVGADYYPVSGSSYPAVGTSRHRFVRAKYPSYQWHVMHTMTEAQFNAAGGHPSALDSA